MKLRGKSLSNSTTMSRPVRASWAARWAVLVAAALLVVAPLSLGTQLETAPHLKLIRIGLCGVGALLAVVSGVLDRIGRGATAVAVLAVFYVAASAWSPFPLAGVLYKTIFLSSLVFGLALGSSFKDIASFRWAMRLFGAVAVAASVLVLREYMANPSQVTRIGRLAIYGINANAVGMTAAAYLVLTVFLALTERRFWSILGAAGSAVLITIILATGSRAAMAMAVVAGTAQLLPWIPKPRRVIVPVGIVAILLVLLSANVEVEAIERFTDFEKNTRAGMWAAGVRLFFQSPVIGHGWLSAGRSTANLQNVYLQVLAETGVIGGTLLVVAAVATAKLILQGPGRVSLNERTLFYFAAGIVAGVAVHGIAESSLLHGTTLHTFLFGLGVGLLEQYGRLSLAGTLATKNGIRLQRQSVRAPVAA